MVLAERVGDEHVLGLYVAMDHPAGMGVGERLGKARADQQDLLVLELIVGDQLGKGLPTDELGHEVEGVPVDVGLVQRDDRRVAQPCRGERLPSGALAQRQLVWQRGLLGGKWYPLQRHLTMQQLVVGAPHHPEAPRAEALAQPVAPVHERVHALLAGLGWGPGVSTEGSTRWRVRRPQAALLHPRACPWALSEKLQNRLRQDRQAYFAHSITPCKGATGFCRSLTTARRQRLGLRPGRPEHHSGHGHAVHRVPAERLHRTSTR